MLTIHHLYDQVQEQPDLKGIDLQINAGKVHATMGPTGSGKSTLSKILAAHPAYDVTAGSVRYHDQDLLALSPEERARAGLFMSFQYPVEIPGVTNINFLKAAVNAVREGQGKPLLDAIEFLSFIRARCALLEMD